MLLKQDRKRLRFYSIRSKYVYYTFIQLVENMFLLLKNTFRQVKCKKDRRQLQGSILLLQSISFIYLFYILTITQVSLKMEER